ncbi:MAG: hypothetical protein A2V67_07750 [Deltaproteobacteria bacterium RBG_13_61_14]|nr:MAG: hypothetical protein A2V67_07750 [Deltaproteobacteria bacterium RBG_13_61_14]
MRYRMGWIILAGMFFAGCMTPGMSRQIDDLVPAVFRPEKVAHYARDVVWASPSGKKLKLDVSWPEGEGPFPVLVWIHGGAWEDFSKEANVGLARYITNRGYVVVNVNYRTAPQFQMKTIVEDAFGAVIWAKDHAADYHGDPSRVAVAGHSAGGHLAAMVATACGDPYFPPTDPSTKGNDCSVQAAIPVSGVYEFDSLIREESGKRWQRVFGVLPEEDPELYRRCSPRSYLRADLPAQLVLWGEEDFLREQNEKWVAELKEVGAPVEGYMALGQDHLWPTWHWKKPAQDSYDRMVKFLDEQLKRAP